MAHTLNANSKESPLRFSYTPYVPPTEPHGTGRVIIFGSAWQEFAEPSVTGDIRAFLGADFGQTKSSTFSVRTFIKHYSDVEGGVHLGRPVDELDQLMVRFAPTDVEHNFGLLRGLVSIGVVTLEALLPTYLRVKGSTPEQ